MLEWHRTRVDPSRWVSLVAPGGLVLALAALGVFAPAAVAAAPPNDDFDNAQPIQIGPKVQGSVRGATKERGEPIHARRSLARHSVWYRFRTRQKVTVTLSTCAGNFDSVIAVYSGASLRSLRVVDYDDNSCYSGGRSLVRFTAHRGRTYRIAVAGIAATGKFRLKVALWPAPRNDDFIDAIPITLGSPISGTNEYGSRELGEPGHYLGGTASRTVWYRLRVATGRYVRLQTCNGNEPNIAVYTGGRVDRLKRVAAIDNCVAQFRARPNVTYRVVVFESGLDPDRFRLLARTVTPPANDDFANATPLEPGMVVSGTTRNSIRQPGDPVNPVTNQPDPFTVWYRLTAATPTTVAPSCRASSPVVAVYTGDRLDGLTLVGHIWCGGQMALAPGSYRIQFQGIGEVDFRLTSQATPPP